MKEEILRLRKLGLGYKKISRTVGIPVSTVRYHCNGDEREKQVKRTAKRRKAFPLARKVYRIVDRKVMNFAQGNKARRIPRKSIDYRSIIEQLAKNPTCYLTGEPIDLSKPETYQIDHIIPVSRGGPCLASNLGLATRWANQAKYNLTPEEFISVCQKVVEHAGYEVRERKVAERSPSHGEYLAGASPATNAIS